MKNPIKAKGTWSEIKKSRISYSMLIPYFVLFICFMVIPMLVSIYFSFTSFNLLQPPKFNGFTNFERMFISDKVFLVVLKNTLLFALVTGPVGYILSFVLAWMINELGHKMRMFLTFLFYAPAMMTNIFFAWAFIFSTDSQGIANGLLLSLGVVQQPIPWLSNAKTMVPVLMIVCLWSTIGTAFLAFIAGFQNQDKSLFEAGAIDGVRNRWQELWYLSVPQMAPQLLFGAVTQIAAAFTVGTVVSALAGYPTTEYAADTIVTYIQDVGGTRYEMGYASAITLFLVVMMLLTNRIFKNALSKFSMD